MIPAAAISKTKLERHPEAIKTFFYYATLGRMEGGDVSLRALSLALGPFFFARYFLFIVYSLRFLISCALVNHHILYLQKLLFHSSPTMFLPFLGGAGIASPRGCVVIRRYIADAILGSP